LSALALLYDTHVMTLRRLTAWSSHCSSWFKQGIPGGPNTAIRASHAHNRVSPQKFHGTDPGSRLHFFSALENPRFEDYDWRYDGNRFAYLGNGFALRETTGRDMGEPFVTRTKLKLKAIFLGYYLDDYREEKPFLFEY
jgi:hypothetical protein